MKYKTRTLTIIVLVIFLEACNMTVEVTPTITPQPALAETKTIDPEINRIVLPGRIEPIFIKDAGILHVMIEYFQAVYGLSTLRGGGEFGALTTTYEWWVDAENPSRVKRVTMEWLEDGPHIREADGSDGVNARWKVDGVAGILEPLRSEGLLVRKDQGTLDFWYGIWAGPGEPYIDALIRGEAREIARKEVAPWGTVITIQWVEPQAGNLETVTVRAEEPHILLERVIEREGELYETHRLVIWEWLDPAQLDAAFWLMPPAGIPVGP